jgi:Protein of unknown function (DUF3237)
MDAREPPSLEFAFELRADIGPTLDLGPGSFGVRRTVPILGGCLEGPLLSARILPGGADWQFAEADGLTVVDARYVIETRDGTRVEVRNQGVRHGPAEVMAQLAAGESVPSHAYYFRTTPRFYPPAGNYEWMKRAVFLGSGERHADLVIVRVWKVL